MSSHIWRRAVASTLAGTAVVGGLVSGFAAPAALAQPADSTQTEPQQPRRISPDQVLMMISQEYQTGSGGGQVSKLIEQVMTLRGKGVRPSVANTQALLAALDARPNQTPLVEALQATLINQRQTLSRAGVGPASGAPPVATPGSTHNTMGPAWGPGNPMQRDDSPIFPMPGR
jgi:hypothetical protein